MSLVESPQVSFFPDGMLSAQANHTIARLDAIMSCIKSGVWSDSIERLRSEVSDNKRRNIKSNLPAFLPTGVFSKREDTSITEFSQHTAIDFDKVSNESDFCDKLKQDKHTKYLFKSCSGKGYCLVVQIEGFDNYSEHYRQIVNYYDGVLGLKADSSCCNLSRARFVSYDPDMFSCNQPEVFTNSFLKSLNQYKTHVTASNNTYMVGNRDNALFKLCVSMLRGGASLEFTRNTLFEILAGWDNTDKEMNGTSKESYISKKLVNAAKVLGKEENQVSSILPLVESWIKNLKPPQTFTLSGLFNYFLIRNETDRAKVIDLINSMCAKRVLSEDENIAGKYTAVTNPLSSRMYLSKTTVTKFDVEFPLEIHKQAILMPKNIAVFAGAKSTGKSAMALNIAWMNRDKGYTVRYISSEMADIELRHRLDLFTINGKHVNHDDWFASGNLEFYYKPTDITSIIKPDGLNLIDFLEIHDSFYLVARKIAAIYDVLTTGVAIIFIQKSSKHALGRGSEFSLEKARLYVTLDRDYVNRCGTAKIVDAKIPADMSQPPRGMEINYSLTHGSVFYPLNSWNFPSPDPSINSG